MAFSRHGSTGGLRLGEADGVVYVEALGHRHRLSSFERVEADGTYLGRRGHGMTEAQHTQLGNTEHLPVRGDPIAKSCADLIVCGLARGLNHRRGR